MRNRRVAGAVTACALAAVAAGGCANIVQRRTMTVIFRDTATQAQLESASKACAHVVKGITALPVPKDAGSSRSGTAAVRAGVGGQIQFRIGGADDHDVARLTSCLNRQPGVLGVQPPNDDMS